MQINIKDVKFEAFSGSGAGGQFRNRHMNCCRAIHIPTGIKAVATKERSLTQNKKAALEELQKKLDQIENNINEKEKHKRYKEKANPSFGTEVVRTYRLTGNPQCVVDHQTDLSKSTDVLYKGELDEFIEERLRKQRTVE